MQIIKKPAPDHGPWPPAGLRIGDLVKISGVAFGPQYGPTGATNKCPRGQESVLIVTENGFEKPSQSRDALMGKRTPQVKQYGPPKRGRW